MEERYIATVDLGSSKIALAVGKVEGDDLQVVFYEEVASEGIRYGAIFNPNKVVGPLGGLIKKAQDSLGIKILQAAVGLPRYDVQQQIAKGEVPRSDTSLCISLEEVSSLKNMALDNYPLENERKEMIYCAIAQSFTTDDYHQCVEGDVVGMISEKLEGNFKIFIGERTKVNYIDKVFNDLDIAVARTYFIPEVSAEVVLTKEEMNNGVALIDFGAGVTSVSIFQNGILRHYGAIPFGGASITNDIRMEANFSTRLAENIKMAYGACMPDKLASIGDKTIGVVNKENGKETDLGVRYLSEIITYREKEIIEAMLYEIQKSGYADYLRSGVVITGGASEMTNLDNYLKEMSGYNIRTGYPLKSYSAEGCRGAFETSAVSCMGMMLAARKDIPNCAEMICGQKKEEEEEKLVLQAPEEVDEADVKQDAKSSRSKASGRQKTKGKWNKVEKLLGDLFNGMESDE